MRYKELQRKASANRTFVPQTLQMAAPVFFPRKMECSMDVKLLLTTFGMVFLAELGDKTQLATFCLSADCASSKWSVFIGSASALVLSSAIAVVFGDAVARWIPPSYIRLGAGLFFVVVGFWMLVAAARAVANL